MAFQEPIQQLSPGGQIVFGLAMGPQLVGESVNPDLTPPVFSISATYSFGDRTVTETTTLDVRPYRDSMRAPTAVEKELHTVAEHLEKIANKS